MALLGYRIGKHARRKTKRNIWLIILLLILFVLIAAGLFIWRVVADSNKEVKLPEPITREYAAPASTDRTFDEKIFTITLPEDWKQIEHNDSGPYNVYKYRAFAKNKDNIYLDVYVDRYPADQTFNRLLPVIISDNHITVTSSVSDNCTAFTGSQGANKPPEAGIAYLPAKWHGVNFRCEMGNYNLNIVGVGTEETGLRLVMKGPTQGRHTFFIVYNDLNLNPDFQILERAVESLTVK